MKLKSFFEGRSKDFYFSLAIAAFSIVLAVVYLIGYAGTDYLSPVALIALFIGAIANVLFCLVDKLEVGSLVVGLLNLVAFAFFIYGIYFYVSVVLVGIDLKSFSALFIVCSVMFVALLAGSIVNIFLNHGKSTQETVSE